MVVGVALGGRRGTAGAGLAGQLVGPVVAVGGGVPALIADEEVAGGVVAIGDGPRRSCHR